MRRSLNEDLQLLYEFKDLRQTAIDLRNSAHDALNGIESIVLIPEKDGEPEHVEIVPRDKDEIQTYKHWVAMANRLEAALLIKVQRERFHPTSHPDDPLPNIDKSMLDRVRNLDLPTLFPAPDGPTANESQSNAVLDRRVPVLLAALSLQVLAGSSDTALSTTAMLCYYRILFELTVAARPDWTIGAARAGDGGNISAFVTSECIRGILSLERAFKKLVVFLDCTANLCEKYAVLNSMVSSTGGRTEHPLRVWIEKAAERIWLDWYISTEPHRREIAFDIRDEPPPYANLEEIGKYLDSLLPKMQEATARARKTIGLACDAIANPPKEVVDAAAANEESGRQPPRDRAAVIPNSPAFPKEVLETALREAITAETSCVDVKELPLLLKELSRQFTDVRRNIIRVLDPSRRYVEAVLDRELGSSETSQIDSGELVFAATSYGALSGWESDRSHLHRVCQLLLQSIPANGMLSTKRPFHSTRRGYKLFPTGCEMIRNLAQLLDRTGYEFGPMPIRTFLEGIQDKSISSVDGRYVGWNFEGATEFESPSVWVTAVTVFALDRFVRMLDARINAMVLSHFDVIQPSKPHADLTLNELIYPDYGFSAYYDGRGGPGVPSIAIRLEQMRAHLGRVSLPPLPSDQSREVFAAVLYGPPQTGKTTLAEALALSGNVPLIRLSPFDLTPVESYESIERRTRTVFEAISMLTHVVILLDEFESVLKRRKREGQPMVGTAIDTQPAPVTSPTLQFLLAGLLPQLVKLHDVARRQSVVYCLATNFIDEIDDAAIRRGRFDHWLPVYNPDPLSRAATLFFRLQRLMQVENPNWALDSDAAIRLLKVVVENPDIPATTLAEEVFQLPKLFLRNRLRPGSAVIPTGAFKEVVHGSGKESGHPAPYIDLNDADKDLLNQRPGKSSKPTLLDELRERAWLRSVESEIAENYDRELSREEKRQVAKILYDCLYPQKTILRTAESAGVQAK